jgi:TBC1 domain family member 10
MYAHDWYTTVFSSLPFPYVIRIFDVFLSEGVRVLFRVSLALLKSMQTELLKLDMEGMLGRFKNISKYLSITPDEMINISMSFKIPNRKIERLNREYDMQHEK